LPTYRYECERCGAVHEIFHSMTDQTARTCPNCGGNLVRHVGGAGGVILKGSGFHRTDYRSGASKAAAKADGQKADGEKAKPSGPEPSKGDTGAGPARDKPKTDE
jgi:putative FmdB family regulatory protein